MFKSLLSLLAAALMIVTLGSWGFLVHKTVNQLAIYRLPSRMSGFFYENREYLVNNAPRPDIRRNQDSTEAPRHFIDLEMYGQDAAHTMPVNWSDAVQRYTLDTLVRYGYVPYHVLYMKQKLTDAFRTGNKDSILFYATDIGHYIGDANVPLHTTANYDGQLTGQRGLHSLWESAVPEVNMDNWNLYTSHKAKYLQHPEETIWNAVRNGAALVPGLLEAEKTVGMQFSDAQKFRVRTSRGREYRTYSPEFVKAYAAAVQPAVNQQLLHSAEMIADFWYTSWADAGKPDLDAINQHWNKVKKNKFREEKRYYRNNTLITHQALLSRKAVITESE